MSEPPLSLKQVIEATLYLKGQPLSLATLAEQVQCKREDIKAALLDLMADYNDRNSALEVIETHSGYALQLRERCHALVQQILPAEVGVGALRTLAAIAIKGPISQVELVDLRGSGAYQQVQELVAQGFVRKRRQADGRSYWLQVTEKFHQYFQLAEGLRLRRARPAPAQNQLLLEEPPDPDADPVPPA